jgi:hypothetical protein
MHGYRGPHETVRGGTRATRHPRRLPAAGGDSGEVGGVSTEEWSRPPAEIEAQMKARSLLGRVTTLADVGNAATFLASDLAGATTGTVFNLTSGTVVD